VTGELRQYVGLVLDAVQNDPEHGWKPDEHTAACTAGRLLEALHVDEYRELCVLVAAWLEQHEHAP
jgi:hypothetical protein